MNPLLFAQICVFVATFCVVVALGQPWIQQAPE